MNACRLARRRWLRAPLAIAATIVPTAARSAVGSAVGSAAGSRIPERFATVPPEQAAPPPLGLHDLDGKRHDLGDYRGRVVLVNFWATWCAPCLEEIPSLQWLQARLAREPFAVLLVNYGEARQRVEPYVEAMGLEMPVLLDAFHRARHDWKVRALPTSFLVDRRGLRRHVVRGELDWSDDAVVQRILSL